MVNNLTVFLVSKKNSDTQSTHLRNNDLWSVIDIHFCFNTFFTYIESVCRMMP